MKQIPDKSFWQLWNISFGFFGVQIAYALQSANISRIRLTKRQHQSYFFYFGCRPTQPELFLAITPLGWHYRTTICRGME